jgi:anaerobic ribonucleoside-triphosphate reductase activating protein
VKEALPKTKIYIWTGYLYEDLQSNPDKNLQHILSNTDVLIDGPFIKKERDITLFMRGSKNQRILYLNKK